jgi:hypothetical protein
MGMVKDMVMVTDTMVMALVTAMDTAMVMDTEMELVMGAATPMEVYRER